MKPIVSIFLAVGLLAGCSAPPAIRPPASNPSGGRPLQGPLLAVDGAHSLVTFRVFRAGPLARLGHDHVLACRCLSGRVSLASGEAELILPLEAVTVDEPGLRRAAGLDPDVDEEAVAGTRRNLQRKVFDTARYPLVRIRIRREGPTRLQVSMTVRAQEHAQAVPARMEPLPGGGLRVTGAFTVRQSDFGMTPFSVLGGALQVADAVDVRFDVSALPMAAP
ncbi:MAG: YceI family protein [Betaproteobacteria bacterium]|nr:YceI family protein [Betaproteobacteria bacterium]